MPCMDIFWSVTQVCGCADKGSIHAHGGAHHMEQLKHGICLEAARLQFLVASVEEVALLNDCKPECEIENVRAAIRLR